MASQLRAWHLWIARRSCVRVYLDITPSLSRCTSKRMMGNGLRGSSEWLRNAISGTYVSDLFRGLGRAIGASHLIWLGPSRARYAILKQSFSFPPQSIHS